MESRGRQFAAGSQEEVRRQYDGRERIGLLPFSRFIAIAPAAELDEPVWVFIGWADDFVERPLPGSSIWRAALRRYFDISHDAGPEQEERGPIRSSIEVSLARFTSLEAWLYWCDHERPRRIESAQRHRRAAAPTLPWPW
jgi:hypothetical protein